MRRHGRLAAERFRCRSLFEAHKGALVLLSARTSPSTKRLPRAHASPLLEAQFGRHQLQQLGGQRLPAPRDGGRWGGLPAAPGPGSGVHCGSTHCVDTGCAAVGTMQASMASMPLCALRRRSRRCTLAKHSQRSMIPSIAKVRQRAFKQQCCIKELLSSRLLRRCRRCLCCHSCRRCPASLDV